jgi:N-acyl-D-amino-acid deacylase
MAEPAIRQRILAEDSSPSAAALQGLMLGQPSAVYRFSAPYDYEPSPADSLAEVSARSGQEPLEVLYDWTIAEDGLGFVMLFFDGYPGSLDGIRELLEHPSTVLGLGDGGAHVSMICDAGYPTHLLSHWVRDRAGDRLPVEVAIRALTSEPAGLFGMHDRGVVTPGRRADLNVIDPDRVALRTPEVVRDLPADAKRITQRADGFAATVVAGVPVQREGQDTEARPGAVVRGSRPNADGGAR